MEWDYCEELLFTHPVDFQGSGALYSPTASAFLFHRFIPHNKFHYPLSAIQTFPNYPEPSDNLAHRESG